MNFFHKQEGSKEKITPTQMKDSLEPVIALFEQQALEEVKKNPAFFDDWDWNTELESPETALYAAAAYKFKFPYIREIYLAADAEKEEKQQEKEKKAVARRKVH